MKLAKTVACGLAAFGLAAGGALAGEGYSGMNDGGSPNESAMAQEETYILREPVDVAQQVYGVDENRDGVTDSYLYLEESDTLAMSEGEIPETTALGLSDSESFEPEPSAGG
jgi:hypothetical protein